ncbi:hypothetical protein MKY59_25135 [Paenibacillus sp. FSL W8-0426]|uniref:hypothetical protein n=1 Tax=Paenibacillus sp. FSL W8-0426 TaxID=2921714 RepID=UPI0030D94FF5
MNGRQRQKIIPSLWIIVEVQSGEHPFFSLYAVDWKRGGRLCWEGWERLEELLQFHVPIRRKVGSTRTTTEPCAKIAKKARHLRLNEASHAELERLFHRKFSRKAWKAFVRMHQADGWL